MKTVELDQVIVPEVVLSSAEFVMSRANDVQINDSALTLLRQPILDRLAKGIDTVENAFGTTGNLNDDVNLVFFETAVNFCFWAQEPGSKWKVDYQGEQVGGWYGLSRAFYRAVQEGVPLHDAAFMSRLTVKQAADIFRGIDGIRIPLLEPRVNNLVEAARFLLDNYKGSARTFIETCDMSAVKITQAIVRYLPSFRDGAWYDGKWVWILKRAQILSNDLNQLGQKYPEFRIHDTDRLTAFADYRVPQVLRHYGVLEYSSKLSALLDAAMLLPSQSPEEVEIRMATILACEKLKQICEGLTSADIDLALWLLSQELRRDTTLRPHHLTFGIYY